MDEVLEACHRCGKPVDTAEEWFCFRCKVELHQQDIDAGLGGKERVVPIHAAPVHAAAQAAYEAHTWVLGSGNPHWEQLHHILQEKWSDIAIVTIKAYEAAK